MDKNVTINLTIAGELLEKLEAAKEQVDFVQAKLLEAREGIRRSKAFLHSGNLIELERWLNYADDALAAFSPDREPSPANWPSFENPLVVKPDRTKTLWAYCDGGASPNPGNGGYGYVVTADEKTTLFEGYNPEKQPNATNNQMEIQAAIAVLSEINSRFRELGKVDKVIIRSDSKYLIFTGRGDWKVNADNELTRKYWRDLFRLITDVPFLIEWEHIPRDSSWFNTRADHLSNRVR